VDVPERWTGPSGHVLDEPWMQNFFRDDLAVLIRDLEASGVPGLAGKRTAFRIGGLIDKSSEKSRRLPRALRQAQASNAVLEQRAELLVGAQLAKAGVLTRMRADTPDFEGRWGSDEFGVEVTTRARSDVAQALHDVLEEGLRDGLEVLVTLGRTGKLFTAEPETIAEAGARVIAEITRQVGAAKRRAWVGGDPGAGLGAVRRPGVAISDSGGAGVVTSHLPACGGRDLDRPPLEDGRSDDQGQDREGQSAEKLLAAQHPGVGHLSAG
jgi:hypothetical protein